jgi:hypothetical protein
MLIRIVINTCHTCTADVKRLHLLHVARGPAQRGTATVTVTVTVTARGPAQRGTVTVTVTVTVTITRGPAQRG